MHYYQHNIGDYRRDTIHLSLLEHGVYRQLLDMYYLSESPIPRETQQVIRRLSARTEEEKNAVEIVLKEFFTETEAGFRHKRCDVEIEEYRHKAEVSRENGKKGGRPKQEPEPIETRQVISGYPKEKLTEPELINALTNKPIIKENIKERKKENPFLLPDWIDSGNWNLWMKTRKGKKMIEAQMQKQVDKLRKWKDTGQDYAGALENAAINGYVGLFLPDNKAPPQPARKQKFCSTELMYGMDGYGNKINEDNDERIININ